MAISQPRRRPRRDYSAYIWTVASGCRPVREYMSDALSACLWCPIWQLLKTTSSNRLILSSEAMVALERTGGQVGLWRKDHAWCWPVGIATSHPLFLPVPDFLSVFLQTNRRTLWEWLSAPPHPLTPQVLLQITWLGRRVLSPTLSLTPRLQH